MEVTNTALFVLWHGQFPIAFGSMQYVMEEAAKYASHPNHVGEHYDICFDKVDGDPEDENASAVKGDIIITYRQYVPGKVAITTEH